MLATDASAMPAYADYMRDHADELPAFVAADNLLLSLAQPAALEPRPPYLPPMRDALRVDAALDVARVLVPDHFAVAAVPRDADLLTWRAALGHGLLAEQHGATELLASADDRGAALLDLPFGEGRYLLSALALDRPAGEDAAHDEFAAAFYTNLAAHLADCEPPEMGGEPTPGDLVPTDADSTVFVVLPDTQVYALEYPGVFAGQTAWIADNVEALNIRYVFHLGDVVNDGTVGEWKRARDAMARLDGVVPYMVVPGNHDYQHWEKALNRNTSLSSWFTYDEASALPTFGGAYVKGLTENTYHLFSAAGHDWIALALEWGPRDEVVAWADAVMHEHHDRLGILVTHAYLNNDDRRYDHTDKLHSQAFNPHNYEMPGTVNDGEELWQKLVRRHRFVMTLSGHVLGDGAGYLASRTDLGNTCHQMLSNYQMRAMGGEGYLRILEIHPDGRTVAVRTYSPLLGGHLSKPDHEFGFDLDVD